METTQPRLIILRGNSGSGKSSIAKQLREQAGSKIAIVEQDYLRRFVLKEKESEGVNNIKLVEQTVNYCLSKGYDVVLEGILYFPRYKTMLKRLIMKWPNHFVYYLDIPFEETLHRHNTKPNAHEFGENEMRKWYKHRDLTKFDGEIVIDNTYTLSQTVKRIIRDVGL